MAKLLSDWSLRAHKYERLWLLAKIEFKLRYYENKLGLFWALLKPILDICIYYVSFKVILKSDVPNFASYLFIALILWNFFLESTGGTIQILQSKKYLYEYSNMNKLEIYVSTLFANSIGFYFNFLMFLLFFNFFESSSVGLTWYNLWIIPLFINIFILSLGVSLILSTFYIIAKDITQLWAVFTSFLFFLSPVFYKLSTFKGALPGFIYLNPIAGIMVNARSVMMFAEPPSYRLMLFDFVYAIIFLIIGLIFLNKLGAKAAEKL